MKFSWNHRRGAMGEVVRQANRRRFAKNSVRHLETLEPRVVLSCDGFLTYSQGGWGGNGAPADYLSDHFASVFASGAQVGAQDAGDATDMNTADGERAALFTTAAAIIGYLPVGGPDTPPVGLNGDSVDPANGSITSAGTLVGHTLAMTLNLGFDAADPNFDGNTTNEWLGDLTYNANAGITTVLNGMTVAAIVAESNAYLSGASTPHSGGTLTEAMRLIIQEWDNGVNDTTNVLTLTCDECGDPDLTTVEVLNAGSISGQKWEDHDGNGLQDAGDDGIPGWTITLSNLNTNDVVTTTTDAFGNYTFSDLIAGDYRVEEELRPEWTNTTVAYYDITLTSTTDTTVEELNTDSDDCIDEIRTTITTTVSSEGDKSFGNFENIEICGLKYNDHNANGLQDLGDEVLAGWTFILNDGGTLGVVDVGEVTATSGTDGIFCFSNVGPGAWTVTEAVAANWVQTQGETGYAGTASSGNDVFGLIFGNSEIGSQNGKTIGFWSNNNGQALVNMSDVIALNDLNLKTASGADLVLNTTSLTTAKSQLKNYLLKATATNMAYMLSAQLAATVLNVRHGHYGSSTAIYIDGMLSAWSGNTQGANLATNLDHDGDTDNADVDGLVNQFGFADINTLIAAANASLADSPKTLAGHASRAYQEALKIAFDGMNNNLAIFVL